MCVCVGVYNIYVYNTYIQINVNSKTLHPGGSDTWEHLIHRYMYIYMYYTYVSYDIYMYIYTHVM